MIVHIAEGSYPRRRLLGLRGRELASLGASSSSIVTTVVTQAATLPLFLAYASATAYGEWLLVTSIPAYLTLSDFGVSGVVAARATRAVVARDYETARAIVRTGWLMVTLATMALGAAAILLSWIVGLSTAMGLTSVDDRGATLLIVVLVGQVVLWVQAALLESVYRSVGRYTSGILGLNGFRWLDLLGVFIALILGGGLVSVALAMLLLRAAATTVYYLRLTKVAPWAGLSWSGASVSLARTLLAPSLAYASLPLGSLLGVQGAVLIIGTQLGPLALVSFVAVRTFSNLVRQLNNVVNQGLQTAITHAIAENDLGQARRLYTWARSATFAVSLVAGLVAAIGGTWVIGLWTSGSVEVDRVFLVLMILVVVLDAPYLATVPVLVAADEQQVLGGRFLLGTALSLGVMVVGLHAIGLVLVPLAMVIVDIVVTPAALRRTRHVLGRPRSEEKTSHTPGGSMAMPQLTFMKEVDG